MSTATSSSASNSTKTQAVDRLKKEWKQIILHPSQDFIAAPLESDLLTFYYVLNGPKSSPFENGRYFGKLVFPPLYPFKPPSVIMITPNGRFKTNTRICMSMSDFHSELWNPLWTVSSILQGLLSFMLEDEITYGSIETSTEIKKKLAKKSLEYNVLKQPIHNQLFPEMKEVYDEQVKNKTSGSTSSSASNSKHTSDTDDTDDTDTESETNRKKKQEQQQQQPLAAATQSTLTNRNNNNNNNNQHSINNTNNTEANQPFNGATDNATTNNAVDDNKQVDAAKSLFKKPFSSLTLINQFQLIKSRIENDQDLYDKAIMAVILIAILVFIGYLYT